MAYFCVFILFADYLDTVNVQFTLCLKSAAPRRLSLYIISRIPLRVTKCLIHEYNTGTAKQIKSTAQRIFFENSREINLDTSTVGRNTSLYRYTFSQNEYELGMSYCIYVLKFVWLFILKGILTDSIQRALSKFSKSKFFTSTYNFNFL